MTAPAHTQTPCTRAGAPARLIHRRFDDVARSSRTRVALRTPSRDTTFAELLDGSERVACLLDELGCAREDRIAILARDHAAIVTAMLGVLKAGCAFAPLDAGATDARLQRLFATLSCKAIVIDAASRSRLHPFVERAIPIIELDGARPVAVPRSSRGAPSRGDDPDAMCSVYFTSGSTGAPRAIAGRLSGIDHHIEWEIDFLGLDRSVRGTILHATSYDAYLADVLVPMCAGGVACAPADREIVLDPARLLAWIESEEITLLHCVPSLFRTLLDHPDASRLSCLRYVLLAGEVVRPADVRAARAVLAERTRLVNLYGPSEATLVKLHHEITAADADRDAVPIGVPMPEVTVHILDERGEPCVTGEVGQIAIQSAYGSLGYLDEPALTRTRFLDAPAGSGEQLYLTGDYGRWLAEGRMAFHGRRDRQIKLWGARVDLDEVEAILCSCDGVMEAAVVLTEGGAVLRGFVVLSGSTPIARVREQAIQRLSPAMRLAWLTQVDTMPRTASGKLDRRQLVVNLETER
jgi:amino acid adenylation domain-containing protein